MGSGIKWVHDEQQHMRIKNRRKLIEYKIMVYRRELKRERDALEKLIERTQMRKEVYRCIYDSRAELDEAYRAGKLTDKEYIGQRSALWKVYSDHGHNMRIEWLQEELEKCEKQLEMVNEVRDMSAEEWQLQQKRRKRSNHKAKLRMRRYRKRLKEKAKREAMEKKKI